MGVTLGIYVAGTVRGAHLNPAVTLGLAGTKRFAWSKVAHCIIAQFAGAFAGAALLFAVYYPKWIQVDVNLDHTTGVFSTFPAVLGFFDQVVGAALLIGLIPAIRNQFNAPPSSNLAPIVIGLLVLAIGISWSGMQGHAINPACDRGPRRIAVPAGFKNNGLTDGTGRWLPRVLGPIVGGLFGAFAYDLTIGRALLHANAVKVPMEGLDPGNDEGTPATRR